MILEELKIKADEFVNAIKEYRNEKDYNEIDLERMLDYVLCRLPRDIVYVEWFDRSQIKYMADSQLNNDEASEDMVDSCIYDLWNSNDSLMTGDDLYERVADSIRTIKGE